MPKKFSLLSKSVIATLALQTSVAFAHNRPDVVYGEDSRKDLYQLFQNESLYKTLAASTALLTTNTKLSDSQFPGLKELETQTLQEKMNVCSQEPFAKQAVGGWCSGFLVAPDTLVTAGHCITSEYRCSQTAIIFDYAMKRNNSNPQFVPEQNIFQCKEILSRRYDPPRGLDYAVIKLDRRVSNRQPLRIRTQGTISDSTKLTIIGHPSGLPTKVAKGAWIRENTASEYFVTNTDSYGGNSGSAVVNQNGEVEGILVRGETDYEYQGSCLVSKKCAEDACRGEDVTRSTNFAQFIK